MYSVIRKNLSLIRTKVCRQHLLLRARKAFHAQRWVSVLRGQENAPHGVILVYHRVNLSPEKNFFVTRNANLDTREFERQLRFLRQYFSVQSLNTIVQCLTEQRELPKNFAVLTFDDGYQDNFSQAFPLLSKYKIPATLFLSAGPIDTGRLFWHDQLEIVLFHTRRRSFRMQLNDGIHKLTVGTPGEKYFTAEFLFNRLRNMSPLERNFFLQRLSESLGVRISDQMVEQYKPLNWEQVRSMYSSSLVHLGCHSMNHQVITQLEAGAEAEELQAPQELIRRHVGVRPRLFAYPMGEFDRGSFEYLKTHGYSAACTTQSALVDNRCNPFAIPRIGITGEPLERLVVKIVSAIDTWNACSGAGDYGL